MIKTIIFDFGDVFINLDKTATTRELNKLGSTVTAEMIALAERYEIGALSTDEFITHAKQHYPNLTETQLIHAWNAIILDFPEYRLEFLETLTQKNNYRRILLSNTNALHIERVKEAMTLDRYERFKSCFDQFYLSHEIGYRKPNADIFEFVLTKNQLKPGDCLFIDDTAEHLQTASKLGLEVWHLTEDLDVVQLFELKNHLFSGN